MGRAASCVGPAPIIIGKLAESRGFNLVLPSSEVLMFAPALDLTEPVLAQLNDRLPNVKVPEKVD